MDIQNKKIAFIGQKGIPAEFPGTSGVEFFVQAQAEKLVKKGNKVTCYVRYWATPKKLKKFRGINLIHLPSINTKHLDAFSHSFLASLHVCFTNADIVWYQTIGPAFSSFIPKFFGKKIYTTIHGLDWQREKWEWWAKLFLKISEKVLVKFSDRIFVVSKSLKKYYWQKYHRKSIYFPAIVPKLKKIKPNIIYKKYGLKGNDYLLYMGRFVPEKRVHWLIKAYQNLKPKKIKLVLAGGESHSRKYFNYLKKLAVNNKNIIFTNYVFGKEKQELFSNCKVFILPSSLEGASIALKEALSLNKKCLITNIFAYEKLSKKVKNVYFFKINDYQNFFRKFTKLINQKKKNL